MPESVSAQSAPASIPVAPQRLRQVRLQSATSRVRWLILASLGYGAPSACGGRALVSDLGADDEPGGSARGGGAGGALNPSRGGSAGSARGGGSGNSFGGFAGTGMTGGIATEPAPALIAARPCEQPILLGGGFQRCADGVVHRPRSSNCENELPRAVAFDRAQLLELELIVDRNALTSEQLEAALPCIDDSGCVDGPRGYCALTYESEGDWLGGNLTYCRYGCVSDAECGSASLCRCGSPVGSCVAAECQNDRECPTALACTEYELSPGCGYFTSPAFACETFVDECATHADCGGESCLFNGQRRQCGYVGCPEPGRPFIVDGGLRLAALAKRDDWGSSEALAREPVHPLIATDPVLRRELSEAWSTLALMEHASVASFARFALQLLAVGAPAELLVLATRGMQDETRHAQACFALARRYGREDVGPGALSLHGVLSASDFESAVLAAVEEGCIGETVAALEAAEAAEHCVDMPTREVLERIARDEAEHAELAWRFVAWALPRATPALLEQVRDAFQAAGSVRSVEAAPPSLHDLTLLAFGVVSTKERKQLRCRALSETVLPCGNALLESISRARNVAKGSTPSPLAGCVELESRGLAFAPSCSVDCRLPLAPALN